MSDFAYTDDDTIDTEWTSTGMGKEIVFAPRMNEELTVRFVTDPSTKAADHGWCMYREADGFPGLIGNYDLPDGLKLVPVKDFKVEYDPSLERNVKKAAVDPILQRMRPSQENVEKGLKYPDVAEKFLTNVIYLGGNVKKNPKYNPVVGQHIVLKLSKTLADELMKAFANYRKIDPTWSAAGKVFTILSHSRPVKYRVEYLSDYVPADELPEPLDTVAWVTDLRRAVEKAVEAIDNGLINPTIVEDSIVGTDLDPAGEDEIVQDFVDGREAEIDWNSLPPATIRRKLNQAGVPTAAGLHRNELVALAKAHLQNA
jgi:hypothetical protein